MSDKKSIKSSTTKKPTFKTKTQFFNARLTKTKITLRQIAECGQHGILDEDLEGNAEIDSFNYMHCLIEGFRVLGGLHWALDSIQDRLNLELYYVIERAVQEVDQRNESTLTLLKKKSTLETPALSEDLLSNNMLYDLIGIQNRIQETRVFRDLLDCVYDKFVMVVQAHKFLTVVIGDEINNDPSATYSIQPVWLAIQSELKGLLYAYGTFIENRVNLSNAVTSMSDSFQTRRRSKVQPVKFNKKIFEISGISIQNDLISRYKNLCISSETNPQFFQPTHHHQPNFQSAVIDKYANTNDKINRRLLISPDPYNILVAFAPTCSFLDDVEDGLIGSRYGSSKIFLDDFILNVFLPGLDERLLEYFDHFVNGIDAFQIETYPGSSEFPLIKSSMALKILVQGMCRAIYSIPVHQEECVKMIENVLGKFYEKCSTRFRGLLSSEQPGWDSEGNGIISSQWACDEGIVDILSRNVYFCDENTINKSTMDMNASSIDDSIKEIEYELKMKRERSFHRSELVFDHKKIGALANLQYSIGWFVNQISQLRTLQDEDDEYLNSYSRKNSINGLKGSLESLGLSKNISEDSLPEIPVELTEDVKLTMSEDMQCRYDDTLKNYQQLSNRCLFALRLELRCHSIFYLELAMREGNYYILDEPFEPDPYIWSLNQDLTACDEILSCALSNRQIRFIFDGLSTLMSYILVGNLRHVKRINQNGIKKLLRNLHSLEQCLTNISTIKENGLDRGRKYFELLQLPGKAVLDFVEGNLKMFSYDECRTLLDQIFDEELNEGEAGSPERKEYSICIQRLKHLFKI